MDELAASVMTCTYAPQTGLRYQEDVANLKCHTGQKEERLISTAHFLHTQPTQLYFYNRHGLRSRKCLCKKRNSTDFSKGTMTLLPQCAASAPFVGKYCRDDFKPQMGIKRTEKRRTCQDKCHPPKPASVHVESSMRIEAMYI